MRPAVFLDSGIFVAMLTRRDQWHEQAAALFSGPTPRWMTSTLVIAECYSWFLHKMGEEQARILRQFIDQLKGLRILDATAEHHRDVVAMLERFRGAKLTYTDASSLVHLTEQRITTVWSTDHHLSLSGAEVRPRS